MRGPQAAFLVVLLSLSPSLMGQETLPSSALARLGSMRFRHPDIVCTLAFDPDGKTLFSAGGDKGIRRWRVADGKELGGLPGHTEEVRGLLATPNGKQLISCALERGIRIWNLDAPDKKHDLLEDHKDGVEAIALSSDGETLASGGRDHALILWKLTGTERQLLVGHENSVTSVAFRPGNKVVASGSWDQTIRLWNVENGKTLATLKGHTGYVEALAWSPDGKHLASGSKDGTIRLWNADGKQALRIEGKLSRVWSLAYSHDGKRLFAGGEGIDGTRRETLFALDAATGKEVWKQAAHLPGLIPLPHSEFRTLIRGTACVVVSPDGKMVATCGADGRVRLWDSETGRDLHPSTAHDDVLSGIVGLHDGETIVTASLDGSLRWWESKTGKEKRRIDGPGGGVTSLALSMDGKQIVAGGLAGNVGLWDATTGEKKNVLRGSDGPVRRVAFSPDGSLLALAAPTAKGTMVALWDTATFKEVRRLEGLENDVQALVFRGDGKHLAAVSLDEPIRRWEVATGKPLSPLTEGLRGVTALAYSPDGRQLAAAFGGNRSVVLWDAATGARLLEFDHEGNAIAALAFSPEGETLATAHADGKARLWETRTGKERRRIAGHVGSLTTLAFSPDGRRLLTGSSDQTALVWDRLASETAYPRTSDALSDLWRDLASDDATRAYDAMCTLLKSSEEATAFLRPRVQPLPKIDAEQLKRWIANLDARAFKAREEAMENLTRLGHLVERPLKDALNEKLSLDARRRIEELLKRMDGETPVEDGKRLGRALEMLELIGSDKAREVVQTVANGGDFDLTRAARAALERMKRRKP